MLTMSLRDKAKRKVPLFLTLPTNHLTRVRFVSLYLRYRRWDGERAKTELSEKADQVRQSPPRASRTRYTLGSCRAPQVIDGLHLSIG
jgi:hypothetical protein